MAVDIIARTLAAANSGEGGGGTIDVDDHLSTTSENPVQNKVVTNAIQGCVKKNNADDVSIQVSKEDGYLNTSADIITVSAADYLSIHTDNIKLESTDGGSTPADQFNIEITNDDSSKLIFSTERDPVVTLSGVHIELPNQTGIITNSLVEDHGDEYDVMNIDTQNAKGLIINDILEVKGKADYDPSEEPDPTIKMKKPFDIEGTEGITIHSNNGLLLYGGYDPEGTISLDRSTSIRLGLDLDIESKNSLAEAAGDIHIARAFPGLKLEGFSPYTHIHGIVDPIDDYDAVNKKYVQKLEWKPIYAVTNWTNFITQKSSFYSIESFDNLSPISGQCINFTLLPMYREYIGNHTAELKLKGLMVYFYIPAVKTQYLSEFRDMRIYYSHCPNANQKIIEGQNVPDRYHNQLVPIAFNDQTTSIFKVVSDYKDGAYSVYRTNVTENPGDPTPLVYGVSGVNTCAEFADIMSIPGITPLSKNDYITHLSLKYRIEGGKFPYLYTNSAYTQMYLFGLCEK